MIFPHAQVFALLALSMLVASCSTTRTMVVSGSPRSANSPTLGDQRARIDAYTTTDGVTHSFTGHVERVGDSLHFVLKPSEAHGLEVSHHGADFYVSRDSVASVSAVHKDLVRTAMAAVGATLVFGMIIYAVALAVWAAHYSN